MIINYVESSVSTNTDVQQYNSNLIALWGNQQTEGRGQRGTSWESEKDKNLTFSILVRPYFLSADKQFVLSKAISTVIADVLSCRGLNACIKWPNDIYIGDKKICGILIECNITGMGMVNQAVIGVGLNVNQEIFVSDAPNPTSMKLECGCEFNRKEIIEEICTLFETKYNMIAENLTSPIDRIYHSLLYRSDNYYSYRDNQGGAFEGKIEGVNDYGALMVRHKGGDIREYQFKEIIFEI